MAYTNDTKKSGSKDEKILAQARDDFERCQSAEAENREEGLDDLRFARLSEQWPEEIRKKRDAEGRPCLTINRLPAFIRQVVNDSRQNKPAVQVHPVDSQADPKTAEILSGLIRNIEYASDADVAYDTAVECAVTTGFGYFRIATEYAFDDAFDLDIVIKRIANQFTVYGDPDSTAADSSDWNVAFVTDMYTKAAFEEMWPDADPVDFDGSSGYASLTSPWREGDHVMVAEYWTRKKVDKTIYKLATGEVVDEDRLRVLTGQEELDPLLTEQILGVMGMQIVGERQTRAWKVTQHILSGCEVLETNEWAGRYIPIIPVYGDEVNEEGKRHFRSLIRDAKDPQRMLNFWRTASTEIVALAPRTPWIGQEGQFDGDPNWQTANTESHAYLTYQNVDGALSPPMRQPLDGGPALGAMQEAMSAGEDMKTIIGIHDAGLGQRSNEISGVAIKARQREGDVSTFHFIDNLSRGIRHAGRVLIDLIPTVYNGQRMIRILGEDKKAQTVPLGVEVPANAVPGAGDDQMPEGAMRIFDLSAGKYDVTVEAGPSFSTKREEAATQMMEFIQAFPAAAPIIGDLFAANLDWPGATEIAARLKTMLPEQLQGQNPVIEQGKKMIEQLQQQLQAVQQQAAEAIQKLQDERQIDMLKTQIDGYNAETNRIKALGTGMTAEQVQTLVVQTIQQTLQSPDVLPMPPQMPLGPPPGPPQMPQGMQPNPQPGPAPGFLLPQQ